MRAADNVMLPAGRGFLIAWQPTRNAAPGVLSPDLPTAGA
jgi:hypothetical protein